MDADKLADFGTIKTAHGDVEAAFCNFFFSKGPYYCIIRISYNVLLYASLAEVLLTIKKLSTKMFVLSPDKPNEVYLGTLRVISKGDFIITGSRLTMKLAQTKPPFQNIFGN